ncbi:MAG TPA: PEP-CTERM sorting domain-containing protein [Caulobacteraceae bacterium]|nr:PEP-CTERM sorting domain-containing protein [Caulobacteraceae bacterium]
MKARLVLFAAALGGALSFGASAGAASFLWSYSGVNGGPVSASGTLQATPNGGGVYTVTSISGMRNGLAITGLTTYAGDDNLVYTTAPNVDYPGLAYTDSNGNAFNVYYDTSLTDAYACGQVGYCEIGPGAPGSSGLGPPSDSIGPIASFTLTAVPEPGAWALMLIGFAGIGALTRGRIRAIA